MVKCKKLLWWIVFLMLGIFAVSIKGEQKEYIGRITTEELETISYEVRKNLPEEYRLTQTGCSHSRQKITLQFENYKGFEIRFKVKRICMQSEIIREILERHQVKRYEVMDLFVLREGGPALPE